MRTFKFFKGVINNKNHVNGFEFIGYSERTINSDTREERRFALYRHIESEEIVRGHCIYHSHPDWNSPEYIGYIS